MLGDLKKTQFVLSIQFSVGLLFAGFATGCGDSTGGTSATGGDGGVYDNDICEPGEVGWPDCSGTYSFACRNDNLVNYHTNAGHVITKDNPYSGCVYIDPLHPLDPTEGAESDWQSLARDACSRHCQNISYYEYSCDPGNWTDVLYQYPCSNPTPLLDLGPVLAILGEEAASAASQLPCDLGDDCSEMLDPWANEAMWTPPDRFVRYTADILTESSSASVQLAGAAPQPLVGQAAYTPVECEASSCPFYLAQLDLGAFRAFRVTTSFGGTTITKTLDGLSVSLEAPTIGMWLPETGDVIFPPNSLRIRVNVNVSGGTDFVGENGFHSEAYSLGQYVFGSMDGNSLSISASGADLLGTWALQAVFEALPPM